MNPTDQAVQQQASRPSFLPKDWRRAPTLYLQKQPVAAVIFLLPNIVIGTIGIWLPLVNYALTGGHTGSSVELLLQEGALYMYAIPFLAATGGVVVSEIYRNPQEQSLGTKVVLVFVWALVLMLCGIFVQLQLLIPKEQQTYISFIGEIVVGLMAVIVGIYMYAIIQNETSGSPADDMTKDADDLRRRAEDATASAKDFD